MPPFRHDNLRQGRALADGLSSRHGNENTKADLIRVRVVAGDVAGEPISLATASVLIAFGSSARSFRLPLSNSVYQTLTGGDVTAKADDVSPDYAQLFPRNQYPNVQPRRSTDHHADQHGNWNTKTHTVSRNGARCGKLARDHPANQTADYQHDKAEEVSCHEELRYW